MNPPGARSPLLDPHWRYVERIAQDDYTRADWETMDRQRDLYYAERQAADALRMLAASRDDPTFGYMVNNYRHSLQSATMVMRDGGDDEAITVALLHDVGFIACPKTHGEFAHALLAPYVSERNGWMLTRHALFQDFHARARPGVDADVRERWRGHPHFAYACEWVDKYDQAAVDPAYECAPLEAFEPAVRRVFARPPRLVMPE